MAVSEVSAQHALEGTWQWFAHDMHATSYSESSRSIGEPVDTIELFWRFYNHLPNVATLLPGRCIRVAKTYYVDSLIFFRKGILPQWEHPDNAGGGEWVLRDFPEPAVTETTWRELLVAAASESLPALNGVRFVCKPRFVKIEMWYHSRATEEQIAAIGRWASAHNQNVSHIKHS